MHPGRGRDIRGSLARFHRNLPFRPPFSPLFVGFSVRVLHHALWTTLWILDFRKQTLAKSGKKGSHSSAKPNGKVVQKVGSKQREPHARVRAEVDDVVRLVGNSPLRHVSPGPRKRGEVRRPPLFRGASSPSGPPGLGSALSESPRQSPTRTGGRGERGRAGRGGDPPLGRVPGERRERRHTRHCSRLLVHSQQPPGGRSRTIGSTCAFTTTTKSRDASRTPAVCFIRLNWRFSFFRLNLPIFFTRLAFFRCGGCSVRTNTCHTRVLRLPLSLCFRAFRLQESSNFSLLLCSSSRQHRRNVFTSSSEAARHLPF